MSHPPPSGPGKTSPKLHDDFLNFDPNKTAPGRNLLADHLQSAGDGVQPVALSGECKHEYTTKHVQSILPPLDLRPDGTTAYKLAVVCKRCRLHAAIHIDYALATNPCPNQQYPLHHFQRLHHEDGMSPTHITYAWQCSASQCQASLRIIYNTPRFSDQDRLLLTDTDRLKRRYEAALDAKPGREDLRLATPNDTLNWLRKYIQDGLDPQQKRRAFSADNKRFVAAFGQQGNDCSELLTDLGFKYADGEWTLPNPPQVLDRLRSDGGSHRERLEDVVYELAACMSRITIDTGAVNPAAGESWPSASRDVERTLAAQGYQRHTFPRRSNTTSEEHAYFSTLGALSDFADTLVEFAFDRQINCDPEAQAYYFECLQVISESRNTEQLQTKVVMLQSEGHISRRDITKAYRSFGLQLPSSNVLYTDQHILSTFQAQLSDVSPAVAADLREALYKIGCSRDSSMLMNASRQTVETVDDALAWLGNDVHRGTEDDFLVAVASSKMDSDADTQLTKSAISVLARSRQSNKLNTWLTTGRTDGGDMSVDEALRHLGIEQKLDDLDKSVLEFQFDSARQDKPGEQTERAIKAIQDASGRSSGYTQPPAMQQHAPGTWPVGLKSHGNTCYLNSLLQYYFSIKPFREIVLEYGQHKLDLHETHEKKHRVGGRIISAQEIKGGQRFAKDLQGLFQRMIVEPSAEVKPEKDMVSRAFLEAEQYDQLPSSAMDEEIVWDRTRPATRSGSPAASKREKPTPADEDSLRVVRQNSNASSVTLQASENGENDAAMVNSVAAPPTPPDSPTMKGLFDLDLPEHAPPLPPRRRFTNDEIQKASDTALSVAEKKAAAQQDVSEVHDNATQRLRAGLKVDGVDEFEEQQDILRQLYTLSVTDTTVNQDGTSDKPKLRLEPCIQLRVPQTDTDLYSALDEVLDPQPSDIKPGASVYASLLQPLPPILQINSPRIDWDAHTKAAKKFDATMRLVDELYLDRYCDQSGEDILSTRKQGWVWRRQLRALEKERKELMDTAPALELDSATAMTEAGAYLKGVADIDRDLAELGTDGLDLDLDLAISLQDAATAQAERLTKINADVEALKKELAPEFQHAKKIKYRLAVVFFHRGNTSGGHYWVCIHDFANDIWRSYNDETVSEVSKDDLKQIFEAQGFNQGTPTYMVYVQDDKKEELVQPLCREPEPADPWPVQMVDATETTDPKPAVRAAPGTVDPKLIEGQNWDAERVVEPSFNCGSETPGWEKNVVDGRCVTHIKLAAGPSNGERAMPDLGWSDRSSPSPEALEDLPDDPMYQGRGHKRQADSVRNNSPPEVVEEGRDGSQM
ncbi:hypothetical protein LTR62_002585 [Meristemomyces frigidus]|uniref:ubiquitinyl hydrolase 1 n=1 Tax=Meristemomyces frigidus TaxID=1508187 RepID=A0AAN7YHF4_9PEZI|nr:hypothetical protein LTR62_002585 [Meristemomyces frigidus]